MLISVEVDDNLIKAIIDSDRHSTIREIAEKLHVSHTCIENHLKQLSYVQKLDTWVPHEQKEKHLTQRINSCDLLKKRNENDPFLKRLAMKNGLFTTISSGKDRGAGHVNQLKKIELFHEKIVFHFLKKIRNYLVANPIFSKYKIILFFSLFLFFGITLIKIINNIHMHTYIASIFKLKLVILIKY